MTSHSEQLYSNIDTVMDRIDERQRELARLHDRLKPSIKMQSIWAYTFDAGSCKFSGRMKFAGNIAHKEKMAFVEAWFEREDGMRYYLTKSELQRFKPEARIHKDYEF